MGSYDWNFDDPYPAAGRAGRDNHKIITRVDALEQELSYLKARVVNLEDEVYYDPDNPDEDLGWTDERDSS